MNKANEHTHDSKICYNLCIRSPAEKGWLGGKPRLDASTKVFKKGSVAVAHCTATTSPTANSTIKSRIKTFCPLRFAVRFGSVSVNEEPGTPTPFTIMIVPTTAFSVLPNLTP